VDMTSVILHQDNAPHHKAASTLLEIDLLGFKLQNHPAYSPDLAHVDFKMFPEVKRQLKGTRLSSAERQNATQIIVILSSKLLCKLIKGKALRKHSLHEKTAASVLLKLFKTFEK